MNNQAFDMFKNNFDFNQALTAQRRNMETLTEVNQVLVEGAQAATRCGSETVRTNMETVMKSSKDVLASGSPEAGLAKQADLAKTLFENTLSSLREVTEMATKCSFEAFELLNKRATENLNEFSKSAASVAKKKN